ncbi:MAG TPA: O-antigen ligase family protein [Candidatus Polarisedimenticolia bacterium]
MTGLIIEGGLYALLLFTPFAFGGVELWAQGILQIVTGVIVVAWVQDLRGAGTTGWVPAEARAGAGAGVPAASRVLWTAIGLFLILVVLQVVPMPPGWIRSLSPETYTLYSQTIPGYAQGRPYEPAELPAWVLAGARERMPAAPGAQAPVEPDLLAPPMAASGFATEISPWRTLSIYPYGTWSRLSLLLCYVGIFAVVSSYYRTRERLGRLLGTAAFTGFAVSIFGIIQKLTWNGKLYWIREGTYLSPFGPFVNRNSYAAYAGTILPLALCAALGFLRQREQGRTGALPRLVLWGFASVVMTCGIFYSLSRGGILSAALSLAIIAGLLLYYGRSARELAVLAILAIAAAAFLGWIGPEKVIERVGTLSEGQSVPSMATRIVTWGKSMDLIAANPMLGTGLGTYAFAFMRSSPPGEGWWDTAHNEFLELLCDTGLAGAALFLIGLTAWAAPLVRARAFRGSSERFSYMGMVAGIAGLLLHSAISSNLQIPANGLLLTVLGAALTGLFASLGPRRSRGRNETSSPPPGPEEMP